MNFSSIIRKNLIHNLKKYISLYFVNTLIVAMLFMYGSLVFNSTVKEQIWKTSLYTNINMALLGIILFSIVFITYSNISFLKYRGKEFGMYFTLGMTSNDLSKLIVIENIVILIFSLISGIVSGSIFSRMFYMGINKILVTNPVTFELNIESFLLTIVIFGVIFLCNVIFTLIYIRKVSIIEILKSSNKKEIDRNNIIIGLISMVLLTISLYYLPKMLFYSDSNFNQIYIGIFIILISVCPYVIIGSILEILKIILKRLPKLYNSNILVLSNLSHRFLAFRSTIYIVSVLIALSIFFVGYSYSLYAMTSQDLDMKFPNDILFIETDKFNKINKDDLIKSIESSGGKIDKYSSFEYIDLLEYRYDDEELILWSNESTIISESNYNKHMNNNIKVNKDEAIYVSSLNEEYEYNHPETVLALSKDKKVLEIKEDKIKEIEEPFTNFWACGTFYSGKAFIVDNEIYENIKDEVSVENVKKQHLIKGNIDENSFNSLLEKLRTINNLDESYWKEATLWGTDLDDERGLKEDYKPIYKNQQLNLELENNGIVFFTMIFIGVLFMIASGVVLYYKVLSDIEDDTQRIKSLNKIGVTQNEINNIITTEMSITFILPMFIGGSIGIYLLYVMYSNSTILDLLMKECILILLVYLLIYIPLYLVSRRKYIREIKNRI